VRMRSNLLFGRKGISHVIDEDTRHSLPIAQMGNYQDYLKKQPVPLRELESPPVRQHMFGNPYKTNKNLMMMTDEVGLGEVDEIQIINSAGQSSHSGTGSVQVMRGLKRAAGEPLGAPPKRRKGPLSKDFKFQIPSSSPVRKVEYPSIKPDVFVDIKPSPMLMHAPPQQLPPPPQLPPQQPQPLHHQFNGHNKPIVVSAPSQKPHNIPVGTGVVGTGKMAGFTGDFHHPTEPSERLLPLRNSIEEKTAIVNEEPLAPVVRAAIPISNHKLENFKNSILKNSLGSAGAKSIADTILSNMTEMHSQGNSWLHHNGQPNDLQHHKTSVEHSFCLNQAKSITTSTTTNIETTKSNNNSDSDKSVITLINLDENSKNKLNQRGSISLDLSAANEYNSALPTTQLTNGPSSVVEEPGLTDGELRSIKLRNNNVRQLIYKEVKRPGRLYTNLWKMLEELHGPPWVRRQFIQEVKLEALRFKRSVLATQLEEKCKTLS